MNRSLRVGLVLVLAGFQFSAAQNDVTVGVQLGLHGGFTTWDLDDIEGTMFERENGPTFGGSFGWGMSDWLGLFTRVDLTSISPDDLDSYTVTHWDIGVRAIPMLLGPTIRPYAEAYGAFRFVELTEPNGFRITASGPGLGFGAGLYAFITGQFAVNAGFGGTFGNLEEVSFGGFSLDADVAASSLRFAAGVSWFP